MKHLKSTSIIALAVIMVTGCKPEGESRADSKRDATVIEGKAILVKTQELALVKISRTIDYTATLQAFEEVHLAPAAPGRVNHIYVEIGDKVNKETKLFLMDQTQLGQAQVQLKSLETDLGRMETLLETGSITQQLYDQLKTQYDVTMSNVRFLSENTVIYAPFSGVITGKYFENGEMFSGAPNTMAGKAAVVTLMQVNPLKCLVSISEQYYPLFRKGMKAQVKVDVFKDVEFSGNVILVHPTINPMTRSFDVEIEIPNSDDRLKPGMFARVSMFLGEEETFVVPANIVLQQEGTNLKYIFRENKGFAERIDVTIGKRYDDRLEIISSELNPGDQLIIQGQARLSNADRVEVVK
ncbi:MAG TPA: efflux RND transporter periplasmic adaptor subunit [Bacteroidales bacterium]|nr:efflux RND transporter periplasmic adaptor subunit [Bacteroidales bacterium]